MKITGNRVSETFHFAYLAYKFFESPKLPLQLQLK